MGADDQAQHGRGRLRRLGGARPRRHRPAGGDAGDGGQGAAVQGARRRRRVPALPRDPGRRRDRRVRQGGRARASAASTSRTSPRRAASRSSAASAPSSTSRSSTTTSTAPRSSCSPPCSTRCASSASRPRTSASSWSAPAPPGSRAAEIILAHGVRDLVICDIDGALYPGRPGLDPMRDALALRTNPSRRRGTADELLAGADVMIGVSGPGAVSPAAIRAMAPGAIVFAMANPVPEVRPEDVGQDVAIMATGRSDYPNQINNVLAFPGVFQGALEVRASAINEEMKLAAALAHRRRDRRRRAARRVHRPERVQPARGRGGRHRRRGGGGADRRRAPRPPRRVRSGRATPPVARWPPPPRAGTARRSR